MSTYTLFYEISFINKKLIFCLKRVTNTQLSKEFYVKKNYYQFKNKKANHT